MQLRDHGGVLQIHGLIEGEPRARTTTTASRPSAPSRTYRPIRIRRAYSTRAVIEDDDFTWWASLPQGWRGARSERAMKRWLGSAFRAIAVCAFPRLVSPNKSRQWQKPHPR